MELAVCIEARELLWSIIATVYFSSLFPHAVSNKISISALFFHTNYIHLIQKCGIADLESVSLEP